jgi:hypothetical protein
MASVICAISFSVGHVVAAVIERRRAVLRLFDDKFHLFENLARDFAHDAAVIHDQALLHGAVLCGPAHSVASAGKHGLNSVGCQDAIHTDFFAKISKKNSSRR